MTSLCINILTRIINTKIIGQDTNSFSFLVFCWQILYAPKRSEHDRFLRFKQNCTVIKRFKTPPSILLSPHGPKSLCLKMNAEISRKTPDWLQHIKQFCHMRHRSSVCIKTLQLSWFLRVHRIFMLKQFCTA